MTCLRFPHFHAATHPPSFLLFSFLTSLTCFG
jgi:hypothetical protein